MDRDARRGRRPPTAGLRALAVAAAVAATTLVACSSGGSAADSSASSSRTPSPAATSTPSPLPVAHPTLWLCRPGLPDNPCEGDLDTVVVHRDGSRTPEPFRPAENPSFDCFYVYPTVSKAAGRNAPLAVAPELVFVVRAQAALFQRACRLYAPVYRQIPVGALTSGGLSDAAARALAHADVVSAWHDYLNTYNDGRPFLLLGHSQGTFELQQLVQQEIDLQPALQTRMVSAMLIGGQVTVRPGADVGGSFVSVPACRSADQAGCVVAYNSFAEQPPARSFFGRTSAGREVLCVNPAAPDGGRAMLHPYLPRPSAPGVQDVVGFTACPDAVVGQCRSGDDAHWLQVGSATGSPLPVLPAGATTDPAWGLHRVDVTVALGDLVDLAVRQAAALAAAGPSSR